MGAQATAALPSFSKDGRRLAFRSRVSSETWLVPDEIFAESVEELRLWVEGEYGDLDQPREDQVKFSIDVAQFA